MPDPTCPRCQRAGLVRKENIKAGFRDVGGVLRRLRLLLGENTDGERTIPGKRPTDPPPDRSRS